MKVNFNVIFEDPFWVGITRVENENKVSVARWVFGSEPSESEIYNFLLNDYDKLKFHEIENDKTETEIKKNPKRIQKEIKKTKQKGINLKKSYDIIKKQYEDNKIIRKKNNTKKKQEIKELKFNLKQNKKKQKHRGH